MGVCRFSNIFHFLIYSIIFLWLLFYFNLCDSYRCGYAVPSVRTRRCCYFCYLPFITIHDIVLWTLNEFSFRLFEWSLKINQFVDADKMHLRCLTIGMLLCYYCGKFSYHFSLWKDKSVHWYWTKDRSQRKRSSFLSGSPLKAVITILSKLVFLRNGSLSRGEQSDWMGNSGSRKKRSLNFLFDKWNVLLVERFKWTFNHLICWEDSPDCWRFQTNIRNASEMNHSTLKLKGFLRNFTA